ncbi:up-regulated during skeletal muscle growth 5 homolog (mouse) [Nesidiocoris tenuis]|uniref:Up-regulated during skeletal muscle growth 5 homolog (Mouse) n=1 Tax=Nesidiocoris tenuis TaxID=355587 RepID=A0ABN7AL07_9HEMI|nr:up-regulated during skeletal muscle growth 5 homolog (mouse) [Nesidiocoris tenuis]
MNNHFLCLPYGPSIDDVRKGRFLFSEQVTFFRNPRSYQRFRSAMSGENHVDESKFTGLSKYFNSETLRGRANVAKATYAVIGVIILYQMVKPKKK